MRQERNMALLILTCLLGSAWLALFMNSPPSPVGIDASSDVFSAGRAVDHLKHIAENPRPSGSKANYKLASYLQKSLTELGWHVEVQEGLHTARFPETSVGPQNLTGSLRNVIATLKGSSGRAVLLMAHYDSVPHSKGASDNGAAVAALLESARVLANGPKPLHDIILLFSDSEEDEQHGAKFFSEHDPRMEQINYVFNFDARGSNGPVMMFETSPNNKAMIAEFQKAVPQPFANSLSGAIYAKMSNITDFTPFKEYGLQGMNFAFINSVQHYHTRLDNIEHLDQGSLQHHGNYALALAKHFGNLAETDAINGEAIYFNVIGSLMVRYSDNWVWPLTLLALLCYGVVWTKLRALSLVSPGKTVVAIFAGLLLWFLAVITSMLLWQVFAKMFWQNTIMVMHPYASDTYFLGFLILGLLITTFLAGQLSQKLGRWNLVLGSLILPILLLLAASTWLPGASWLLLWPLLVALPACLGQVGDSQWIRRNSALTGMFATVLYTPIIYALFGAFPISMLALPMLLLGILLTFLLPQLLSVYEGLGRRPALAVLVLALLVLFLAGLQGRFSEEQPEPGSVLYALDANSGEAILGAVGPILSQDTRTILGDNPSEAAFPHLVYSSTPIKYKSVAAADLAAPIVELLESKASETGIELLFKLEFRDEVNGFKLELRSEKGFEKAMLNDQELAVAGRFHLLYRGNTHQPLHLRLDMQERDQLTLDLVDMTYQMPDMEGIPKGPDADSMANPYAYFGTWYQYTTFVRKTFNFDALEDKEKQPEADQ